MKTIARRGSQTLIVQNSWPKSNDVGYIVNEEGVARQVGVTASLNQGYWKPSQKVTNVKEVQS